jgi:hypothetical protein
MVLADRPELEVLDQHELVVADVEGGGEHVLGPLMHADGQLGPGLSHSPGRVAQALAIGVLAHGEQQLPHRCRRAAVVEVGRPVDLGQGHRVDRRRH